MGPPCGHNAEGLTPLVAAVLAGNTEIVALLLGKRADPDLEASGGYDATPLMYAASKTDPAMVNLLLEYGADPDIGDNMGDPAINWAAYYGNKAPIEALLKAGARTDLRGHGNTVEILMRRGFSDLILLVLAHDGNLHPLSDSVQNAVLALETDNAADLKLLLADGLDPDALDETGRPLLQRAARTGANQCLTQLLAAGAEVNMRDAIGFTALFEAAREGHASSARLLLEAGADPNIQARENALKLTATHLAALGDSVGVIEVLASAGTNLDQVGTQGGTAMVWGLYEEKVDAVIALLKAGADPDIANQYGDSATSLAANMNLPDLITALGIQP